MATEEDVAAGLLNWANSLNVADPVYTVDDLATGEVLWKLLQLIDPLAFPGTIPEDPSHLDPDSKESWIPRWTNLKHIYDALSIFLIEECGQSLPLFQSSTSSHRVNPDLKAIAQHGSLSDAVLLLKLCVVAATSCQDNIRFLQPMQDLPEGVQRVLMETIQEAQDGGEEQAEEEDDNEDDGDYGRDGDMEVEQDYRSETRSPTLSKAGLSLPAGASDLAFEERLAKVIADSQKIAREKHDLQRHIDDLNSRYNSLQERYDKSQEDLSEANDRLGAVLSGRSGTADQSSSAAKETIIAQLEARVSEYEIDIDQLRKSNEVLKIKSERTQKLQDDYDELRIERDSLSRKANAADKYRQKLEVSQTSEKENQSLRQKIVELQSQLRQSDTRTATSSDLQREIDEYRRLLPSIEQERHEVNEMKKRLEFDYQVLEARYVDGEEQLRRTRREVEDLQSRLRDYEDGTSESVTPRKPTEHDEDELVLPQGKDLESEEAEFEAAQARLQEGLLRSELEAKASLDTDANGEKPLPPIPQLPTTTSATEDNDIPLPANLALDDESNVSEDELRAIMSAMRAQMAAGTAFERDTAIKTQKKMIIMLEKARTRNAGLVEYVKVQRQRIAELREKEKAGPKEEDDEESEKQKEENEKKRKRDAMSDTELQDALEELELINTNLKREIRLISSAWYESHQRISSLGAGSGGGGYGAYGGGAGAVSLMRLKGGGGEEPRTFLGRQRRRADGALLGVAVGGGNGGKGGR